MLKTFIPVTFAMFSINGFAEDCAPFPADFVPFAKVDYISKPNKAGDRLIVGKIKNADDLYHLRSLPMVIGDQKFCGFIKLSETVIAQAYVPTFFEVWGTFLDFNGLLIDPDTLPDNPTPFSNGDIPPDRLKDILVMRLPAETRKSVFLLHGIRQKGGEDGSLAGLAKSLRDPWYGLDWSKFVIDAGFDYGECSAKIDCGRECSITNGGNKLAQYIKDRNPVGDIILIGYSMGGLIARDMIVHHPQLFENRKVELLITLGTPNLGYPHEPIDDIFACGRLSKQMFGDFLNFASTNPNDEQQDFFNFDGDTHVAVSKYLYNLNTRWSADDFPGRPRSWMAVAGTYCKNSIRLFPNAIGCLTSSANRNASIGNDGVVCDQSASYGLNFKNHPNITLYDGSYSHADSFFTFFVFCQGEGATPLYSPPPDDNLIRDIRNVITKNSLR